LSRSVAADFIRAAFTGAIHATGGDNVRSYLYAEQVAREIWALIDTPGVRTLRPDVDAQALGATFTDIEALAFASGDIDAFAGEADNTDAALASTESAWAALRSGGHVLIVRHAQTVPGIGDPPGFRLEDCATQRNLSDEGREQARRIGKALQAAGVAVGEVLSSRWCRCLDTATEAFGRVTPWPAADSFFDRRAARSGDDPSARQTAELRSRVAAYRGKDTLVVVTHQVNITALTGIVPAMGELVVLKPDLRNAGGFTIAGRLPAP
jgi:broad specificity phosphatase PhoE